jgi:uncharacterized protein YjbJ (UPF0337 family)
MGGSMGMRSRPIGTGRENSTKNAPQGTAFHSVTLKQLPEDMSTNPRSQYAGGCFEPGTGSCSTAARPDRNGIHGTTLRVLKRKEVAMDWNRVEGNWKQVKGKVKEQWGKLTDDDLDVIAGKQDQLQGKLQERYGYAKDRAQKEMDDWYGRQTW